MATQITLQSVLSVAGGLFLLYLGASALLKGSASLALRLGLSPLVVGLTVVAFATSMPELFVVLKGSLDGHEGISVGNVVGSNIFNVFCILGIAAMLNPLDTSGIVRRDLFAMLALSAIVLPVMWRGYEVNRFEGGALIACYGMAIAVVLGALD